VEQMKSLLSSCMITAPDAAALISSSFCLDLPGCSTVIVIPHMERIEDVILVCCLAHCRRKFYKAVSKEWRKVYSVERLLEIAGNIKIAYSRLK